MVLALHLRTFVATAFALLAGQGAQAEQQRHRQQLLASASAERRTHAVAGVSSSAGTSTESGPGATALAYLAPNLAPELHPDASRSSMKLRARGSEEPWAHALVKAFFVVSVAELFDKTWFMSLILALKLGWQTALIGGYSGLLLHCVLSALLGFGFSKLLRPSILDFITAALFFLFTLLYAKDWYYAEPSSDLIASGKEEAAEAITDDSPIQMDAKLAKPKRNGLAQSFIAVFLAEWGDRTQMAMIGLHSAMPVVPVFIGSALAFLALTASAVIVASCIAKASLSERLVMGTASLSFLVFGILALVDGLKAKAHGE
mmetsp:Transcript_52018/g.120882  ORF Transcript_52018/g.120882 Transcript_52018/m.120882 type:complete len:317 (+) Transcript_52018:60-1010(+)